MHICHGEIKADGFIECKPDYDIDHRVHLYGGSTRSAGERRTPW
jgi:hypothetical protein